MERVRRNGMHEVADATMTRWFSPKMQNSSAIVPWCNMVKNTPTEGYIGCSNAIASIDFITPTSALRLPVLGIAGDHDSSTPPDLVRETLDLIPGSEFHLIRGAGHLPCVEKPKQFAELLNQFLRSTGHL
jgi:3-oxoadipate enol-lactonase